MIVDKKLLDAAFAKEPPAMTDTDAARKALENVMALRRYADSDSKAMDFIRDHGPTILAALSERAWQDIATAPKDGRYPILLAIRGWNVPSVAYSNTWWTSGFSVECTPTHWLPIPTLPAAPGPQP